MREDLGEEEGELYKEVANILCARIIDVMDRMGRDSKVARMGDLALPVSTHKKGRGMLLFK